MTEPLFDPPKPVASLRELTGRQQRIYELVCSVPGGVTADELGAMLHEQRGRHAAGERCEFCGRDGVRALRERAVRQRVVRRSSSYYEARTVADQAKSEQTVQLVELPGESFEDLFNRPEAA